METLTNKNVELVQTKLELQRALVSMEEEKEEGLKKTARVEMDNIRCQEMVCASRLFSILSVRQKFSTFVLPSRFWI